MQKKSQLREILHSFLSGQEKIYYPPLECSIIQLNPLSITDNNLHYIDLVSHAEYIATRLRHSNANSFKLILNSWNFVFRQIPGTAEDYYFDIEIKDFEIKENFYMLQLNQQPIKLIDDMELSYLFEEKRRKEVEIQHFGMNDNMFNISGKSSLAKSDLSSFSRGAGLNPVLPFNPAFGGTLTPTYKSQKKLSAPGKGSLGKYNIQQDSRKSKPLVAEPFFKDAGVQKPHRLIKPTTQKLTLEEIQDVEDFFEPSLENVQLFRYIHEWRVNSIKSVLAYEIQTMLQSKLTTPSFKKKEVKASSSGKKSLDEKSGKQSAKTKITGFSVETLQAGVDTGLIDWDQVVFNKETLNVLEQNLYKLDVK